MAANNEKSFIRKALESISSGNATALKKNIREALLSKVRKALHEREKELAKSLINKTTKK